MRTGILLWLFLALCWGQGLWAEERILSYDVDIQIRADGSMEVEERIRVLAEGRDIRRGIYRDFPTRYRDRYGNRVKVDFDVQRVLRNGSPEPWFTENLSNGVRLNTGNDDLLRVPAEHEYSISYNTRHQLGFFDDHDELYWNAIGTGWVFRIEAARVTVRLPHQVAESSLRLEAYTGVQGDKGQDYEASTTAPGTGLWHLTKPLGPGQGMTIVMSFPKGLIEPPSRPSRLLRLLLDNLDLAYMLLVFSIAIGFMLIRWHRVGRDPKPGIIIPRYSPPEGLSPGAVRYLLDMHHSSRVFTADLIDLAIKGYLRVKHQKAMFKHGWRLEKCERPVPAPKLAKAQQTLLTQLFATADEIEIERTHQAFLKGLMGQHEVAYSTLHENKHFHLNSPDQVKAVGLFFIAQFSYLLAGGIENASPAVFVLDGLLLVCLMAFFALIPAPTLMGRKLMDQIEGFKLYLKVAERDELARLGALGTAPLVDAQAFQRFLPYAVALEVEDAWSQKLIKDIGQTAAQQVTSGLGWYQGSKLTNINRFASELGSSLSSSIASSSADPGSSSGSGGGSSGGGGGGGGGGGR